MAVVVCSNGERCKDIWKDPWCYSFFKICSRFLRVLDFVIKNPKNLPTAKRRNTFILLAELLIFQKALCFPFELFCWKDKEKLSMTSESCALNLHCFLQYFINVQKFKLNCIKLDQFICVCYTKCTFNEWEKCNEYKKSLFKDKHS